MDASPPPPSPENIGSSSGQADGSASVTDEIGPSAGTKRPIVTLESLPPINREGRNLSEKKLRRLEKNRLSARECRRKKREAAQNLEREINVLEAENLRLRLQLQIGEEAEKSSCKEQEKITTGLDSLLKSGASESEIYGQIEEFKEKFADYGRDRRTAIEFHLRNVARLLMPTTTTSVAMRALHGGPISSVSRTSIPSASKCSKAQSSEALATPATPKQPKASPVVISPSNSAAAQSDSSLKSEQHPPLEPKALFQYLVNYLEVTPEQASALKDSRSVAKELDSSLQQALAVHDELSKRLTQVGEDLEAEMNSVRAILTPTQAAKFLVWVANNGACMHMLNELW
eukprot:CAMPEP_0113554402 /NCGR_PEP_ID=MMETSP0015_2-20120614/16129_1 /TAXON_ID=2838 /ORGANISM="Odontella" /LENGTH=344 /DNA_ID=CAMNT_0000455539 /DNA_START=129 /DNA_END=1160 /DNA_ORIENTATION=- /assembly_acc=CAM_ASM_000160